jgi:hypothetical protein
MLLGPYPLHTLFRRGCDRSNAQERFARYVVSASYRGAAKASTDMTATYPLSIQRRIEQKWAERVKRAAATPAKTVGRAEPTRNPVPKSPQSSTPSETKRGGRSAA